MDLMKIEGDFSVGKVKSLDAKLLEKDFTFVGKTDQELSLICRTKDMPADTITVEHNWKCFRIAEDASFEKYGMIAYLANIIAGEKTSTLVVGTYDTDYLFIKESKFDQVTKALINDGCRFLTD